MWWGLSAFIVSVYLQTAAVGLLKTLGSQQMSLSSQEVWKLLFPFGCIHISSSKLPSRGRYRLFILQSIPQMCCIGWYFYSCPSEMIWRLFGFFWLWKRKQTQNEDLATALENRQFSGCSCWLTSMCKSDCFIWILEEQHIIWDSYRHVYSRRNPSGYCKLWCLHEPVAT